MNKLLIPIHSVIDVITNSSTEIFTQATVGTIEIIKDIIIDLDMSIDVDKSFSFELKKDEDEVLEFLHCHYEDEYSYNDDPNNFHKLDYRERREFIKEEYEFFLNEKDEKKLDEIWITEALDYFNRNIKLEITAHDEKGKLILPLIEKIMKVNNTINTEDIFIG